MLLKQNTLCDARSGFGAPVGLFLALLMLSVVPTVDAEVLPEGFRISGDSFAAKLVSISSDSAEFTTADGSNTKLKLEDLVRWGSLSSLDAGAPAVLLSDGSLLAGDVLEITRSQLRMKTDLWGNIELPRSVVRGVLWVAPTGRLEQRRLLDSISVEADEDQLTLVNGDQLEGRLAEAEAEWQFELATDRLKLRRELVRSWRQGAVETRAINNAVLVGFVDGTRLVASRAKLEEGMEAKLACGVELTSAPGVRPAKEQAICFLQPASGRAIYLGDLEPLGYRHIPFLQTSWDWKANRSANGGTISAKGRQFARGIGMHSTSRLAFDLPQGFDAFHAEVGIDQSAGTGGSVTFRVYASEDGTMWSEVYKSPIVRGGTKPLQVRVDIRKTRRLALVVGFAECGDVLDRANWIDARLVRLQQ